MKIGHILALVTASLFAASHVQAQHFGDFWDGGSGTWNATNTNWDGNNVYFNSNARETIAVPTFNGSGGTVTVDNSAGTLYNGIMVFNGGNWTFNGDDINSISTDYQAQVVLMNPGSGNVTIGNTINIAPNPTNGGSVFIDYGPGTTMELGNINISSSIAQSITDYSGPGNTLQTQTLTAPFNYTRRNGSGTDADPYTYQTYTVSGQTPILYATNGTTIQIDGNLTTDPGLSAGLLIGNYGDASMATGTYIFKGALNENINGGKQFDFGSGNIIFDTSSTGTGPMVFVGAGANLPQTLLTGGNYTISNNIYNQGPSNAILGGSTAHVSTFSGGINAGGSGGELTYRAAAGGRVIFSGNNFGDDGYTSKDGAGTVVLSSPTGNTYTSYNSIVFEAKSGTTLIKNTSGSAFGNTSGTVQLDAGATLGGNGISTQQVVAVAASSIIAPGDAGQANLGIAPSIGVLHLADGLVATSGLTLDFKINGSSYDQLDLGSGDLTLGGVTTVNFTNLSTVLTGPSHIYTFASDGGLWSDTGTFVLNAPAGYTIVSDTFDTTYNQFNVEFAAVPEPSVWALMLGGFAFLGFCTRRKNRTV